MHEAQSLSQSVQLWRVGPRAEGVENRLTYGAGKRRVQELLYGQKAEEPHRTLCPRELVGQDLNPLAFLLDPFHSLIPPLSPACPSSRAVLEARLH